MSKLNERLELGDYHVSDRFDCAKGNIDDIFPNKVVAERLHKNWFVPHASSGNGLYIRCAIGDSAGSQFIARFNLDESAIKCVAERCYCNSIRQGCRKQNGTSNIDIDNTKTDSGSVVLVPIVNNVDMFERFNFRHLPIRVRLYRLKDDFDFRLYTGRTPKGLEIFELSDNRKLASGLFSIGGSLRQEIQDVIERGSDVMEYLANVDWDNVGNTIDSPNINYSPIISVKFGFNFKRATVAKGFESSFKVVGGFYCP